LPRKSGNATTVYINSGGTSSSSATVGPPPPDNRSSNDDSRSIAVSSPTTSTPHDPKFRFEQKVQPIRYQEIQALVNQQTVLIEWYFTSKGIQHKLNIEE
jgi:hypothetical protein